MDPIVQSPRLCKPQGKRLSLLVWLDSGLEEPRSPDIDKALKNFQSLVNCVHAFVGTNACLEFLNTVVDEHIFLIVTGSLGEAIVPQIHEMPTLIAVYVFCFNKEKHEQWSQNWSKIQGVYTKILPIYQELEEVIHEQDIESIPISFLSFDSQTSIESLDVLDRSFLCAKLLKEALLKNEFGKKTMKEFTAYCREQYHDNKWELHKIKEFEDKYRHSTSIWWYTNHCFLYPILNRSLRMMDVDILAKMGFFIHDLDHQIKNLYEKQRKDFQTRGPFIVYRGQGLSENDFNKLKKIEDGLMSFNSFLSSSAKDSVAIIYARRAIATFNQIGIVFKMTIDPSVSSIPFADIREVSFYKGAEQEILFSMNSVFQIGKMRTIEASNNRLWEVELTLTSENHQQINAITQLMPDDNSSVTKWHRVGQFLSKNGKYDKAEKLYKLLLDRASHDYEKSLIAHTLGWTEDRLGKYADALKYYERSIKIDEKILPANHQTLALSYDNIGLVYGKMNDDNRALYFHEKAVTIYRKNPSSKSINFANSLINLGSLHSNLSNFEKANECYREAIEIYEKTSSPNHPSLVFTYNDMGRICDQTSNASGALWCFEKALEKYKNIMPSNHPDLGNCYQNIGNALRGLAEYSKALSYIEKALEIFRNSLPLNHPTFVSCYRDLALIHSSIEEYSKAIFYYEKAYHVCETVFSSTHPDFVDLLLKMGDTHYHMKAYSKALEYYHKGFQICQNQSSSNALLLASFQYGIANTYCQMGYYTQAKPYIEQTVEFAQQVLPSHNLILKKYRKTLESVKRMLHES